jgi:hypothetical protein
MIDTFLLRHIVTSRSFLSNTKFVLLSMLGLYYLWKNKDFYCEFNVSRNRIISFNFFYEQKKQ